MNLVNLWLEIEYWNNSIKKKINRQIILIFKNKIIKKIQFFKLNVKDAINKKLK